MVSCYLLGAGDNVIAGSGIFATRMFPVACSSKNTGAKVSRCLL
jgi:hypothetical protein